jgi:hypothetical protein
LVTTIFWLCDASDRYIPDLLTANWDGWLGVYFLLYGVAAVYLLSQASFVLWQLRIDPVQTKVVYVYLFAIGVSCITVAAFVVDFVGGINPMVKWVLIRAELAAYAVAAVYAWRSRRSYLLGR